MDGLGNPLAFCLTGGNRNDITQARALLAEQQAENLIADKGYDVNWLIALLRQRQINPVIPCRRNRRHKREYDRHL